jgi:thiamine transporter ThiT
MTLKKNILSGLLLAIGFILHQIIPGSIGGMTFDVQLAVLFVIIAVNMDLKNTITTGLASGIITAMTTKFPGGQLPNAIDKIVTSLFIYFLLLFLTKVLSKQLSIIVAAVLGTLVSGTVFLASALAIVGLPAPFMALFIGVVVPTTIANTFATSILYNLVNSTQRAVKFNV